MKQSCISRLLNSYKYEINEEDRTEKEDEDVKQEKISEATT